MLLIKPDYPKVYFHGPQTAITLPPLGLETIAGSIRDIADVRIIDHRLPKVSFKTLNKAIKGFNPDLVGINCSFTSQIEIAQKVAKLVKQNGCRTVVGGWHPTLAPEETLNLPSIDMIVRGEGEITFRELIQKNSPIGVPGVSYKQNGKIIHNPDRDLMNLKHVCLPARDLRSTEAKSMYNYLGFPVECIETSRGCPFSCEFCCIHNFYRHTYRQRSIASVIDELNTRPIKSKATHVFIIDDNFVVNRKWVIHFCDAIQQYGIKKYFITQARVDMITNHPEVFEKMAEAGFIYLFLGLESFSDRTLEKLNKQTKFKQIKSALNILHDLGYFIQGNIIMGADLEDTKQDLISTIEITKSLEIDLPTFSLLTPFPGTKLMEKVLEEDLLLSNNWRDFNWSSPVIKYPNLSTDDLVYYFNNAHSALQMSKRPIKGFTRVIRKKSMKFHLPRMFCEATFKGIPKMINASSRFFGNMFGNHKINEKKEN